MPHVIREEQGAFKIGDTVKGKKWKGKATKAKGKGKRYLTGDWTEKRWKEYLGGGHD